MCLMLYLATPRPLAGAPPHPLVIALVAPETAARLRSSMTLPHLAIVTFDGCSCAFPSLVQDADDCFDGLLGDPVEHARGAACLRALLELVDRSIAPGESVELLPTSAGREGDPPRSRIETATAAIDPERFWFTESHVYAVRA